MANQPTYIITTSGVTSATSPAQNPSHSHLIGSTSGLPPGQWSTTTGNVTVGNIPVTIPPAQTTWPMFGTLIKVGTRQLRYNGSEWEDTQGSEQIEAPKIRVELDGRDMLEALRRYKAFLEDIEGFDNGTGEIVDDICFGLREAIEALEKL